MASSEIVQWRGSGKAVFGGRRCRLHTVMDFRANGSQAFKETTKAIEMEGAVLRDDTEARTSNPHSLERRYC